MNQARRIVKNTGFLYARMVITVFISLYSTRLVLTALGVTDFGIFNVIAGAIAMLTFLNAAMSSATQRFMSYAEGKGDFKAQIGIFNVSVLLHLIIGTAVVIVLEIAAWFLFDGILEIPEDRLYAAKLIFQCMVLSTFFKIISVPYDAVINAHQNMFLVALLGVLEAFLKLAIALFITYASFDVLITYGVLMALMAIILLIIRRIYCHRTYEEVTINLKKHYDKKLFGEIGRFASWSFLGSSTSVIANYGQGIILNMFFGPVVNAAQGIANQVNGQLGAFSTTMLSALNPAIAINEGAGKRSSMLKMTEMGSKLSFFLLVFMSVPVIVEMPNIFDFWLKDVPDYAIIFCRLLLLRSIIEQLTIPLTTSIKAVGNIKNFQIASTILNILPLFLAYLLFQWSYPPYFLYIVFLGYAFFNGGLIIWYAKKHTGLKIPQFLTQVVVRCFAVLLFSIAISYLPILFLSESLIRLCTVLVISIFTNVLLISFLGFKKNDQKWTLGLAKSIFLSLRTKLFSKKI